MADDDRLLGIAATIADGATPNWDALAPSLEDSDRPAADALRLVARVARAYRPESFGHFERLVPLGAGGFGLVYRAWDTRLQRDVALKCLEAEGSLSEARLLAQVRHPNVVTVYSVETRGDRAAVVMELLHGRTLAEVLAEEGMPPRSGARRIARDLCRAMTAVHAAGLVHGDISARNVMLEPDGRVVLMDFGLGRWHVDRTRTEPRGTREYMAPELLEGRSPSVASDLYALGVLLKQLGLPKPRATAARAEDRYATAAELGRGLDPRSSHLRLVTSIVAAVLLVGTTAWLHDRAPRSASERLAPPGREHVTLPPSSPSPDPPLVRSDRDESGPDPFVRPLASHPPTAIPMDRPGYDGVFTVVARGVDGAAMIEIRSSVALSLYALVEEGEETRLVFPIPGRSQRNPLDAGVVNRIALPRGNRVVLVASPGRQAEFERRVGLLRIPRSRPLDEVSLPVELVSLLKAGVGVPADGRLSGIAAPLVGAVDLVRGPWIRRFDVEPCPGPPPTCS